MMIDGVPFRSVKYNFKTDNIIFDVIFIYSLCSLLIITKLYSAILWSSVKEYTAKQYFVLLRL